MQRGIVLDLFGTICDEVGRPWLIRAVPEAERAYIHEEVFRKGDYGTIEETDYWAALSEASGIAGDTIRDEWYGALKEKSGMLALVDAARAHYRTALCTNVPPWFFAAADERFHFDTHFDHVIVSSKLGIVKPEPEIYTHTASRLALPPEQILFVDDRPENVAGAEAVGMKGLLFPGATELPEALAAAGFAVPTEEVL